jgi:glycosyltransferase involved in cell wall biosynthesis
VKVSVLLPVYNGARTLSAAIESVLAQTHRDLELLVLDDASTDQSADVIRTYAARDERVRPVFHQRNEGLASTLNEGLERSEGELVARLDQDDEALPHRLRAQADFMAGHPTVVAAGSFVYHMGREPKHDRLVEFPTDPDDIRRTLADHNCLYHPSVIMRRSKILELGGYRAEFKNAEDYDLWLRAAKRHDLANVPAPLIRYRFSVDGMTLGRKWEQLYYVYLAQAAASSSGDLAEAETVARRRLAETDRKEFFTYVAKGTVAELVTLRMLPSALRIGWRFSREVGRRQALRMLVQSLRRRVRDL